MLESLSNRLASIFSGLRQRGVLSAQDVELALREIRVALLEADVALPVVRRFIDAVRERAVGEEVIRSVTPGQMVVKIVHDTLLDILNPSEGQDAENSQDPMGPVGPRGKVSSSSDLNLQAKPPVVIMMVGLQGSGKTTSTAKLALFLKTKMGKSVLMASLDTQRPAAREQLRVLGHQIDVDTVPLDVAGGPLDIARHTMDLAKRQCYDVVLFDTAGRLHIDTALMTELRALMGQVQPQEVLLVADAMTGQDAVNIGQAFRDALGPSHAPTQAPSHHSEASRGLTGIILTRMDGDARGGAALSMRMVTGVPIKFLGVGEKVDQLQAFDADRLANRILDMGDVISLVEKAAQTVSEEDALRLAKRMEEGQFDLEDMKTQLLQMSKMGGIGSLLGMVPGMGQLKDKLGDVGRHDAALRRQVAIIQSMTLLERRRPDMLNASRKRRIASGSGLRVQDVNKLLKQFKDMSTMMKKFKKMGKKGLMRQGLAGLLPGLSR